MKWLESRERSEIGWDAWKSCVVITSIDLGVPNLRRAWVSGCRLFSVDLAPHGDVVAYLEVYGVRTQGRAEYPSDQVNSELGGLGHLSSTGVKARLPWSVDDLAGMHNTHDSIVSPCVNVTMPRSLWECNLTYSGTLRASAPVIVPWTSGTFFFSIKCLSTVMLGRPRLQFTS